MSHPSPSQPLSRPRLLIVDDDPAVLDVTRSMARALGWHALVADDARLALESLRDDPADIHVVLVDLHMPGDGGLELVRRVRECRPDARVLLMTGDAADRASTLAAGAAVDHVLLKPFSLDGLRTALGAGPDQALAA